MSILSKIGVVIFLWLICSGLPQSAHSLEYTRDYKTIIETDYSGVWTVIRPTDSMTRYVWLYPTGRLVLRKSDCAVMAEGTWQHNMDFLDFTNKTDGSKMDFAVIRVPEKLAVGGHIYFADNGEWMLLARDVTLPC